MTLRRDAFPASPVNARLSWALRLALLLQCSPVSSAELFTQKNFDLVLAHTKLDSKINSLREFDRKNRLTPSLFKQLFTEQEKKPLKNGYTERSTIQTTPIHYLACGPANFFSKKQHNDQLTQANAGYKHHNKQMCKQ
jgi:hypothetical protein